VSNVEGPPTCFRIHPRMGSGRAMSWSTGAQTVSTAGTWSMRSQRSNQFPVTSRQTGAHTFHWKLDTGYWELSPSQPVIDSTWPSGSRKSAASRFFPSISVTTRGSTLNSTPLPASMRYAS